MFGPCDDFGWPLTEVQDRFIFDSPEKLKKTLFVISIG